MTRKIVYRLLGLGCANCASKTENGLKDLLWVEDASINADEF